jgi:uncharacterized protein
MPTLSLDNNPATYQIRSYQPGIIQVNEIMLNNSIIITSHQLIKNWPPQYATEITRDHLLDAIKFKPEILLIGTGPNQFFLPLEIYGDFLNQGVGIEMMNTGAACRTYNALTAEGRNVVAALVLT